MAKLTIEEIIEKKVKELKDVEVKKKSKLQEIQAELKRHQKALEVLKGNAKK